MGKPVITIKNRITSETLLGIETLCGADLRGADLVDADLVNADLVNADLRGADLRGANLVDADLEGADLEDADLRDANLRGANLRGANLRDANLRDANLRDANLRDADLRDANLRGANFSNTDKFFSSPWGFCHIQKDNIRIGCQYHKTTRWRKFTKGQVAKMDKQASGWWKENKSTVLAIAESCAEIGG